MARFVEFGVETSYGATQGTRTGVKLTQFSDPVNRNPVVEESLDQTAASAIYGGIYKPSGTLEGLLRPKGMEGMFHALTGDTTAATSLEFQDTMKSLTMVVGDDQAAAGSGKYTLYNGVGLTRCEISCNVKEFVRTRWNYIAGKAVVLTSGPTVSYASNDVPSVFYNAEFTIDGSPVPAKGVTIVMERKVDEDYYYIGSPFLQGIYLSGLSDINGTITFGAGEWDRIEDVLIASGLATAGGNQLNPVMNDLVGGELELVCMDPDGVAPTVTITLADVRITEMNRSVTGRNQWEKTVNYRAVMTDPSDCLINLAVV
jgi:hypothetical protein